MSKTDIEASEVARRIAEDIFVLDVRNEDDYEDWQIPDSTNIPVYDELLSQNHSGLEANLDPLPEDTEITVVCVAGVTSVRAAGFLQDRGSDAKSVPNGMNAWGRVHREYDVPSVDGIVQIVRPGTGCVSYFAHDGDEAVVGDPTQYIDRYLNVADDRDLDIVGVADTHAHADHVRSVGRPDLEDSSEEAVREASDQLFDSLEKLTDFSDETVVLPGHFSDEEVRPLATELGDLKAETTNELLSYVEDGDEETFVETIVESLSDEPANYNEIKQINWGKEQPGGDVEALELGPNNCAAN